MSADDEDIEIFEDICRRYNINILNTTNSMRKLYSIIFILRFLVSLTLNKIMTSK